MCRAVALKCVCVLHVTWMSHVIWMSHVTLDMYDVIFVHTHHMTHTNSCEGYCSRHLSRAVALKRIALWCTEVVHV